MSFISQILSTLQPTLKTEAAISGDITYDTHMDVTIRYLSIILNSLIASLLIAKEYFFDYGLACQTPTQSLSQSSYAYARAHCLVNAYQMDGNNSTKKYFYAHYFPILILAQVATFSVPHLIWYLIVSTRIKSYVLFIKSLMETLRKEWEKVIFPIAGVDPNLVKNTSTIKFYNSAINEMVEIIGKDRLAVWYFLKHFLIIGISVAWILALHLSTIFDFLGGPYYKCELPQGLMAECTYSLNALTVVTRYMNEAFICGTVAYSIYTIFCMMTGTLSHNYDVIKFLKMNFFDEVLVKTAEQKAAAQRGNFTFHANKAVAVGLLSQIMFRNENILPFILLKSLKRIFPQNVDDPSMLLASRLDDSPPPSAAATDGIRLNIIGPAHI